MRQMWHMLVRSNETTSPCIQSFPNFRVPPKKRSLLSHLSDQNRL